HLPDGGQLVSHPLSETRLSPRALRLLQSAGVTTLAELAEWTPARLLAIYGFGRKCLDEAEEALESVGLSLRPDPPAPTGKRRRYRRLTPEDVRKLKRWRQAGQPVAQIAARLGCHPRTVLRHADPLPPEEI